MNFRERPSATHERSDSVRPYISSADEREAQERYPAVATSVTEVELFLDGHMRAKDAAF